MPFKSSKQRRYMFAKHPKIAKKWAKKYRYGGTIGSGENFAGTSSNGTENRHVFKNGGIMGLFGFGNNNDDEKGFGGRKGSSREKSVKRMDKIAKKEAEKKRRKRMAKAFANRKDGGVIDGDKYKKIKEMLGKK